MKDLPLFPDLRRRSARHGLRHAQNRLISKHGKGKALSIIAKRLGVAVYYMFKHREPFNEYKLLHMTKHQPMA